MKSRPYAALILTLLLLATGLALAQDSASGASDTESSSDRSSIRIQGENGATSMSALAGVAGKILEAVESGEPGPLLGAVDPVAGLTFWDGESLGELEPAIRIYPGAPEELTGHLLGADSPYLGGLSEREFSTGQISVAAPEKDAPQPGVYLYRTSELDRPWPYVVAERAGEGSRAADEHPWRDFRWVLQIVGEDEITDFYLAERDAGYRLTNIAVYSHAAPSGGEGENGGDSSGGDGDGSGGDSAGNGTENGGEDEQPPGGEGSV